MERTTPDIDTKVARIEEIIDRLENDDVSLSEAKALRDEGETLLAELETELDVGDGEILEQ